LNKTKGETKMKKILLAIVLFVALAIILGVAPAYASEIDATAQEPVQSTDTSTTDETPAEAEKTITQTASEWLAEHFGDIVGTIGAAGMLILSFFIKKSMIPAINSAIKAIGEKSKASETAFNKKTDHTVELLELAGNYLDSVSGSVEKMIAEWQKKAAAQGKAYELQTDLINYLLINLRVPNELKAEIAQRAEAVKAAIKEANEG
jgi:hypothetical protein